MPKPPRPSASEVLRHNLLILVGLPSHKLLPTKSRNAQAYINAMKNTIVIFSYIQSNNVLILPAALFLLISSKLRRIAHKELQSSQMYSVNIFVHFVQS